MKSTNLKNSLDKSKIASYIFLILVSTTAGFGGGLISSNNGDQFSNPVSKADTKVALNESQLISNIVKTTGVSVVSVNVSSLASEMSFFGGIEEYESESAGTGIIISEDGYILTNRHVVPEGISAVSVTLSDGTTLKDVEVIGRTSGNDSLDVAFLKIKDKKDKKLTPAKIGDSSKVQVGDKVLTIGNALGQFQNTVTEGIISGFGRSVQARGDNGSETLQNLFQTDAAINPGNSGGPLVNINGEVIGINTAVAGGAQNIGFAIPINDVNGLIASVLKTGKFERPYLGVRYITLTDDYAYEYNLPHKRGAYIVPSRSGNASILSGSPADKAGLKEKDIIIKIGDQSIDDKNSLTSLIGRNNVGDEITVTIYRDGKEQKIKVKLEASPTE